MKPQIVSGAEIIAYIVATLNPEILKKFPGPVRVGKKKSGSGRVAGTRQGLTLTPTILPRQGLLLLLAIFHQQQHH